MGRPRTFDETAVLDAAAREFRVHGFEATSTEQLCEAAGVRRSSLYNAFESKDALFERALKHYINAVRGTQTAILEDSDATGAERLRALVDVVIDEEKQAREQGHAAGCMVVHSFMSPDLRVSEPRVQSMLERDLRERTGLLAAAIRAGQADGSLSSAVSPEAGAMLVNTIISGVRVTAQAGVTADELRRIVFVGLSALLT